MSAFDDCFDDEQNEFYYIFGYEDDVISPENVELLRTELSKHPKINKICFDNKQGNAINNSFVSSCIY